MLCYNLNTLLSSIENICLVIQLLWYNTFTHQTQFVHTPMLLRVYCTLGVIQRNMIDLGLSGWMADFGEYMPADGAVFQVRDSGKRCHGVGMRIYMLYLILKKKLAICNNVKLFIKSALIYTKLAVI